MGECKLQWMNAYCLNGHPRMGGLEKEKEKICIHSTLVALDLQDSLYYKVAQHQCVFTNTFPGFMIESSTAN